MPGPTVSLEAIIALRWILSAYACRSSRGSCRTKNSSAMVSSVDAELPANLAINASINVLVEDAIEGLASGI